MIYTSMVTVLNETGFSCCEDQQFIHIDKDTFDRAKLYLSLETLDVIGEKNEQVRLTIMMAKNKGIDLKSMTYEGFLLALGCSNDVGLDNFYLSIYEEMRILRDIVNTLKKFHLSYLGEIKSGNKNIPIEKDYKSCDFALYLFGKENEIKNKFLLNILELIKKLHEKFHTEVKNHSDFSSILYLNDLLNILDILLKHEETIYVDKKTGLLNLEKLKFDVENNNINTIHLIKISGISDINLLYSYEIGDKVLLKVVHILQEYFLKKGLELYRIGGLEFGVLGGNEDIFREFYEFNNLLEVNLNDLGVTLPIKISIGGAVATENIYDKALQALHESKGSGGYVSYSMDIEALTRDRVNNNIKGIILVREALKSGNFVTYFQGIRDNDTGDITKEEALVRIEKDGKVYTPGQFLEQTKKGGLLGEVIKVVLTDTVSRIKKHNISCSVNISEHDLSDNDMIDFILNLVIDEQIPPKMLVIEVLETITSSDLFFENLKKLKELGFKIAIDDFGTGYSNFARLMILKPDYLKIDGSLIKGISKNKDMQSVVRSILNLAQIIGSQVIAEHVDNEEDQSILEAIGVHFSQGYLFSVPKKGD